ncbi:Aspartate/other aminotransferase [Niveomyces insectorum RCEF 264]|uniref:Aspartate aminotransferase n=1 Tax=Niveomyces insectorum RCEF 264 TaxID=1081102 RepID=A0A167T986_9HYPO|nr:Aspartate/other aminotransferase [Niveomyces insectorum RCEF 264]
MAFAQLPPSAPDASFSLIAAYRADTNENKVDLCPGFYRDENGKPWILPSVRKAKEIVHADPTLDHEHLPQLGSPELVAAGRAIAFGNAASSRIASIQTVSGTGSNHLGARLLAHVLRPEAVWLSDPTWINHTEIWTYDGPSIHQRFYPYYDKENAKLAFDAMISTLKAEAKAGDVIVLHACAHNPTGVDPSHEQWKAIGEVCVEKGLFPLFDSAYQGFATGDVDADAWAIRHFLTLQDGKMELAVAQSFSKNFGLYGERIGALHIATRDTTTAANVEGKLKKISRAEISTPPSYGARVIAAVMRSPELKRQWLADLDTMSSRMRKMRRRLFEELIQRGTPGTWEHLLTDIGMFSMTGLSRDQVVRLKDEFHIYLLPSGRLSVTGCK